MLLLSTAVTLDIFIFFSRRLCLVLWKTFIEKLVLRKTITDIPMTVSAQLDQL